MIAGDLAKEKQKLSKLRYRKMQRLIMYEVRDAILEDASERTYSVVASSVKPADATEQPQYEPIVLDEGNENDNKHGMTVVEDSVESTPDTWDDL